MRWHLSVISQPYPSVLRYFWLGSLSEVNRWSEVEACEGDSVVGWIQVLQSSRYPNFKLRLFFYQSFL